MKQTVRVTRQGARAGPREKEFNDFGQQRLGPVMARLGVRSEMKVTFHPGHEMWLTRSVKITA